jgi:hypothetical protein
MSSASRHPRTSGDLRDEPRDTLALVIERPDRHGSCNVVGDDRRQLARAPHRRDIQAELGRDVQHVRSHARVREGSPTRAAIGDLQRGD